MGRLYTEDEGQQIVVEGSADMTGANRLAIEQMTGACGISPSPPRAKRPDRASRQAIRARTRRRGPVFGRKSKMRRGVQEVRTWLSWGGALHWCSKGPAVEPGEGHMGNMNHEIGDTWWHTSSR